MSKRFVSLAIAAAMAFASAACGGSPTAPTPPTPVPPGPGPSPVTTTVVVRSIETEQPLADVTVTGGGVSATTDGSGTATFNQAIPAGTRLTYVRAGFRTREAPFRANGAEEFLLPSGGGLGDDVFREVAYGGGNRTVRIGDGTRLCVVPDPEFRSESATAVIREGVSLISSLAGLGSAGISLEVTVSPAGCMAIPVQLSPSIGSNARVRAEWGGNGLLISGAVLFREMRDLRPEVMAHELGHLLGLGHNPASGLMHGTFPTRDASQAEQLMVKWLYRRLPLTEWEDRAPQ